MSGVQSLQLISEAISLFGRGVYRPEAISSVPTAEPVSGLYELTRSSRPSGDQTAVKNPAAIGRASSDSTPSVPTVKAPSKSPSGLPRRRSNTIRPVGSRPIAAEPLDGAAAEGPTDEARGVFDGADPS